MIADYMQIEKEIHQKRFRSEWEKLAANLIFTEGHVQAYLKQFLKEYDLTPQQFNILRILRGQMPIPISTQEIRNRMVDRMSDTSRLVERLYQKELVDRRECAADRRLVDVLITQKGLALLHLIDGRHDELMGIYHALSEQEARQLNELLDKLRG